MVDKILNSFLARQQQEGMALAGESDVLDLAPIGGDPAQRYIAAFQARGLAQTEGGDIVEADGFRVGIWLPDNYLRKADTAQVLTYLGPHPRPWHPNIHPPYICAHLRPGTPLVQLIYVCFEIWTWALYGTGDGGLNKAASQWFRRQDRGRFPIDRRPLKRRRLNLAVELTEEPCTS